MADMEDLFTYGVIGYRGFPFSANFSQADWNNHTNVAIQTFDDFLSTVRQFLFGCSQGCYDYSDDWCTEASSLTTEFYSLATDYYKKFRLLFNSVLRSNQRTYGIVNYNLTYVQWVPKTQQGLIDFCGLEQYTNVVSVDYGPEPGYKFTEQFWIDFDNATKAMMAKWKECCQFFMNDPLDNADVQDGFEKIYLGDETEEKGAFIFFIQSDVILSDGSPNPNPLKFTIPTIPGETYNYKIESPAGTVTGITGDYTITLPSAGLSKIVISGLFPGIRFANDPNSAYKVEYILQWGSNKWVSMEGAFEGCQNLVVYDGAAPDLTQCSSLKRMFANCKNLFMPFSTDLWDVSSITDISEMFLNCKFFDIPLGKWDVSNVIDATDFLTGAHGYETNIENYDDLLLGWTGWDGSTATKTVQPGVTFGIANGRHSNCPDIIAAKNYLQTTQGWTINDNGNTGLCGSLPEEIYHKLTIDTERLTGNNAWDNPTTPFPEDDDNFGVEIAIFGSIGGVAPIPSVWVVPYRHWHIDWGDGKVNRNVRSFVAHSYENPGTYQIKIWGAFTAHPPDRNWLPNNLWQKKIVSIDQWGTSILWRRLISYNMKDFPGNVWNNFQLLATDAPDTSCLYETFETGNIYGMSNALIYSKSFTGAPSMNLWDTSKVKDFSGAFYGCTAWDGNSIDQWDMSNAYDINDMFGDGGIYQAPITTENYSAMLVGWTGWSGGIGGSNSKSVGLNPLGTLLVTCQYNSCPDTIGARNYLISQGWNLSDGGPSGTCP